MNDALLLAAFVAAVNPLRVRPGMPWREPGRRDTAHLAAAAVGVLALAAAGAAVADPLLDGLDISPESFRIAAGLVVAVVGAWVIVFPARGEEPVLAGWGAALVPLAFPLLITPEVTVLVLSAGADEGAGAVTAGMAVGLALTVAAGFVRRTPLATSLLRAGSRLLGALLVVAGIQLIIDGIRDV